MKYLLFLTIEPSKPEKKSSQKSVCRMEDSAGLMENEKKKNEVKIRQKQTEHEESKML